LTGQKRGMVQGPYWYRHEKDGIRAAYWTRHKRGGTQAAD